VSQSATAQTNIDTRYISFVGASFGSSSHQCRDASPHDPKTGCLRDRDPGIKPVDCFSRAQVGLFWRALQRSLRSRNSTSTVCGFFQGVGFSRAESLKATLVERVDLAKAGHTHRELEALLHIRVHNTLLGLVRDQRIDRERIEKLYVYVSAQAKRASEQVAQRRTWLKEEEIEPVTEMPVLTVIEVLLEVVRAGKMVIAPAGVAERLRVRGVSVTAAHVEQVFARYGLEASKKRPRSRSRR